MNLLRRLFGDKSAKAAAATSNFADSQPETGVPSSRSVPRREVVHVVLRDSMRRHGIPTDWIECRTLGLMQANKSCGTYVTLIIKNGQDRLLPYVPAFQTSFLNALKHFDPKAEDWLRGLARQFDFSVSSEPSTMPDASAWQTSSITSPGTAAEGAMPADRTRTSTESPFDDLEADLRALIAIRDAAMSDTPVHAKAFKPTERGDL